MCSGVSGPPTGKLHRESSASPSLCNLSMKAPWPVTIYVVSHEPPSSQSGTDVQKEGVPGFVSERPPETFGFYYRKTMKTSSINQLFYLTPPATIQKFDARRTRRPWNWSTLGIVCAWTFFLVLEWTIRTKDFKSISESSSVFRCWNCIIIANKNYWLLSRSCFPAIFTLSAQFKQHLTYFIILTYYYRAH